MANRIRKNVVKVYMSDEELKSLNDRVQELGIQNRSNYLRKIILNGYVILLDFPELEKVISLLGRCGNNLNQYARMANATGSFYAKDIQELSDEFDESHQLIRKLLERIFRI